MNKVYYLSNNGTHVGPFNFETVFSLLSSLERQWTDYVYDETIGEWLMLLEHPDFSSKFSPGLLPEAISALPEVAVVPAVGNALKDREWFLLKDGASCGPFCPLEIIQMLQTKNIFEFDYVWHAKFPAWKRIAEVDEFSNEYIRNMKESTATDVAEVFFRRRHVRAKYGTTLIVHNSKNVFKGTTFEISAGGAGILVENPNLLPGQSLFLHFQPGDGVPPFNAVCQIVSKQYTKERSSSSDPVKYGVKFTTLSQSVRESIKNYASLKTA
jgi:Predicted glycosyltransferase